MTPSNRSPCTYPQVLAVGSLVHPVVERLRSRRSRAARTCARTRRGCRARTDAVPLRALRSSFCTTSLWLAARTTAAAVASRRRCRRRGYRVSHSTLQQEAAARPDSPVCPDADRRSTRCEHEAGCAVVVLRATHPVFRKVTLHGRSCSQPDEVSAHDGTPRQFSDVVERQPRPTGFVCRRCRRAIRSISCGCRARCVGHRARPVVAEQASARASARLHGCGQWRQRWITTPRRCSSEPTRC
jgi:hypothetical protein